MGVHITLSILFAFADISLYFVGLARCVLQDLSSNLCFYATFLNNVSLSFNTNIYFNNIGLLLDYFTTFILDLSFINNCLLLAFVFDYINLCFDDISSQWILLNIYCVLLYLYNIALLIFGNINFHYFGFTIFE